MAYVFDGIESVIDGMNSAIAPSLIQRTEIARGVNLDLRNGVPRTRRAFTTLQMDGDPAVLSFVHSGKWQGGAIYRWAGKDYIVFGIFGRIFMLDVERCYVDEITPDGVRLSAVVDRLYFCQANEYMVIQDGYNRPIIVFGRSARVSACGDDPEKPEVMVGTIMVFGQGRLFVVVDRKYFMAGDIYLPWEPERVLQFTETQYLSGGGAFGLPAWMGNITGMMFQPNVVSGTGLGALVVFAQKGVASFGVQAARSTWNSTDIARVLYQDGGGTGQDSLLSVGNDIFYLGTDGLRSLKMTASELQGSGALLRSLPLSRKVQSLVDDETAWAYQFASGAVHDNKMYLTAIARMRKVLNPFGVEVDDFYFDGLMTIDLIGHTNNPMVYEGITTGFNFLQVFEVERFGNKHLISFIVDKENEINLCVRGGNELDNYISRQQCKLYTPAFSFQTATLIQKRFVYAEVWLSELTGIVDMELLFRQEGYPLWMKSGAARFVSKNDLFGNTLSQIRQKIRITDEANGLSSEESELRNALVGARIQFCLTWSGTCQIERIVFVSESQPEEIRTYENDDNKNELTGLEVIDYIYKA